MPQTAPRCQKCQKTMEEGYVPDIGYGNVQLASWSPGTPEGRRYMGGIKMRTQDLLPLTAFRCPNCGYVELYAPTV